ncbi:MAG: uroporphyrinogen-III C-methyltransferase [Pseudomonadota bacterium]
MAKTEKSTKTESVEQTPVPKNDVPSTSQGPSRGGGSMIAIVALLVALTSAAGTGFMWYQSQITQVQSESRLVGSVAEIGSQVTLLGDRISQLQANRGSMVNQAVLDTSLLRMQTDLDKQIAALTAAQDQALQTVSVLQEDLTQGIQEFIVDDIGQLLKAANTSATILNNKESSLNALSLADAQLQEMNDPRFAEVRAAVLLDIEAIQAAELPDLEKLSSDLKGLASKVVSLPLENEPPVVDVAETVIEVAAAPDEELTFWGELQKIGEDILSRLQIKVQKVDTPPKPLLAPEQRYFLDQNIILSLNKAEVAALNRSMVVYSESLQQAKTWLSEYYDTNDLAVTETLTQLEQLEQLNVAAQLPSVAQGYAEFVKVRTAE